MWNVLLIEPDYKSKFPPLGLLRLSSYHKEAGDAVTFARGRVPWLQQLKWHRVYISSLFTWELPRTVKTIQYYSRSVESCSDIVVGGIGATLYPSYIAEHVDCRVIEGPLDGPGIISGERRAISSYIPDYALLDRIAYDYKPRDAYFCRVTRGCIRKCKFCAVPLLEPEFGFSNGVRTQVRHIEKRYGERQDLIILDNNILGIDDLEHVIAEIRELGFGTGSKRGSRKRSVDFNQGLDARLVTPKRARLLGSICLDPIRLAFDFDGMEPAYRAAVKRLASAGFRDFTTYVLFNFRDDPQSLYRRLRINLELSRELQIMVSAFPMRFIPMNDVHRRHIGPGWTWRYLRGIQCVLRATRGMVGPNPDFFKAAFGETFEEFIEIISMPDRYIMYRNHFKNDGAREWRRLYGALSLEKRRELIFLLGELHCSKDRRQRIRSSGEFRRLLEHYYPNGRTPRGTPNDVLESAFG